MFYCKPLQNRQFWAILWYQFIGFGTFLTIKTSVWHHLLQVNDDKQHDTPCNYDNLMILFSETLLKNHQSAWFVGIQEHDLIAQNCADWHELLENAQTYWANFQSGQDVVNAVPIEYQRSSYFESVLAKIKNIEF